MSPPPQTRYTRALAAAVESGDHTCFAGTVITTKEHHHEVIKWA